MSLRSLFFWLTGAFWLGVGYHAVRCPSAVPCPHQLSAGEAPRSDAPRHAPRIAARPGLRETGAEELARHAQADDCWIAIAGTVYDLTDYVDLHPSKQQEMEKYCGKEGTTAWDIKGAGKDKGQPHTKRAAEFLAEYPQVGTLRK
jgi:predicted heme/steroid binding protein